MPRATSLRASNEAWAVVGDTSPPTAPGTLSATGAVGKATLELGGCNRQRRGDEVRPLPSTVSGFTPALANRIAQPAGTSYVDTTTPGTYYYRVAAEDAAGNIGPASNEASATVLADTTPPSAPSNLTASVTGGTVNLAGLAQPTTSRLAATTSTGAQAQALPPRWATGSPSQAGRAMPTRGLRSGATTTRCRPKTRPAISLRTSNEVAASVADSSPPTAPSGVATAVVGTNVNISWTASSDNVGRDPLQPLPGHKPGFTPRVSNRIAQPLTTLYSDLGLAAGTCYYKLTAEDGGRQRLGALERGLGADSRYEPAQYADPERKRRSGTGLA